MVNFFVAFIQALRYCRGCLNDDSPISARPCSSQSEQPAQMAAPILYLNLAPELHFLITEFLPLHSVVASTLTCKQLLNIHGSHKWDLLSQDPDARSKFFLLLEKDLPGYYLRYSTDRFMKKRFLGSDPRNYVQEPLQQYPGEFTYNVLATRFNYTLSWSHLILALKCEQYGDKYGLTIESFRHRATSTLRSDTVSGPLYHVGISVKPRIIANHLLLKCTYRICRTKQQQYMGLSVNELKCLPLDLCRHMSAQYRLSPWYVLLSSF